MPHWYGYEKSENGTPHVVPHEAEVVEMIYRGFLKSLGGIRCGRTSQDVTETDLTKAFKKKKGSAYKEYCEWLGLKDLDLSAFDVDDMNFRLKKVPRTSLLFIVWLANLLYFNMEVYFLAGGSTISSQFNL